MTSHFEARTSEMEKGRTWHFVLLSDSKPIRWTEAVTRWQSDNAFRDFFIRLLADSPCEAFFWETPPLTRSSLNDEFEFVLVNSPQLAGVRPDQNSFTNRFRSADPDQSVIEFSNLGGDAALVVPCPMEAATAYTHLATFSRGAPEQQQHNLWATVGTALERRISDKPIWLSTSGLGVFWLHIRLDSYPKYYTHPPYRDYQPD